MLVLKEYQQSALDSLRTYLHRCTETEDPDTSFYTIAHEKYGPAPGFPREMPYVCIRIPTGGGKTLVACHAVEVAATELLQTETPLVLWLVPSTAIQEQTLGALANRDHPYRQALDARFAGVSVLDLQDALYLTRPQADSGCTIIVSTMQAFRVEDTLGRRVYRQNGNLSPHFDGLPPDRLTSAEKYEDGKPIPTLANVLNVRRPLVIVDEAHNARTDLSFETLARFNPACILEFTATPDTKAHPSNVLHSVSARELKAEAMIKMPIRLETRPEWKELLSDAIAQRNALEKSAEAERRQTGEYLRPIMLIQAQPHLKRKETVNVDTVYPGLFTIDLKKGRRMTPRVGRIPT
jgi:type III restriction enzyme